MALSFLNLHNINGLRALRALHDLEGDAVAFFQRPISLSHNPGVVDEDIGSIFAADEPVTLRVVEPFYCAAQLTFFPFVSVLFRTSVFLELQKKLAV